MRAAESDAAAVLFPGQGAYDMVALQAANKAYLEVAEVFAEIDKVTLEECDRSLSDVLFRSPSPSVSDLMADEPWVSQLTILGADLAAYRILDRLGFAPDVFVGHSLGEIAALVCAGGYSTEDGARLVLRRVQALESLDRQDAYMAALSTDPRHAQLAIELIADPALAAQLGAVELELGVDFTDQSDDSAFNSVFHKIAHLVLDKTCVQVFLDAGIPDRSSSLWRRFPRRAGSRSPMTSDQCVWPLQ